MLNYEEIASWLEEKDPSAISKLSIYHELRGQMKEEALTDVEISSLVDVIFDVWMNVKDESVTAVNCTLAVLQIGEPLRALLRESPEILQVQVERQMERM